uniref:DUF952 domain-containing protein n=1 Tax=Lotharella globosa TaxID=91324 RepID=A0A7S4DXR8_9EUKA
MDRVVWKVADKVEVEAWTAAGKMMGSELDKKDGFIHSSNAVMVRKVASMFFAGVENLVLLRIDTSKLAGEVSFVDDDGSKDAQISKDGQDGPRTLVKYSPNGCAHIFRAVGDELPWSAVNVFPLPVGKDGVHEFPDACRRQTEASRCDATCRTCVLL